MRAKRTVPRAAADIPDAEDVKGASEIGSNAANIIGLWRNRKLEDELRKAEEAVARGEAGAAITLQNLQAKPPVIMNVAKQRNGDWEGKVGLWFNTESYQYRSARDNRFGRNYVDFADYETADDGEVVDG